MQELLETMATSQGRRYYAIKNALTPTERKLIDFYELQWLGQMRVPTIDEVAEYLGKKHTAVNYYLQRKPVVSALEKRGIPFRQHTQEELTSQQVAAATVMMNFADNRPAEVKLDELGVLPATYYAWLNDPTFKNFVETLSERNLGNIKPAAVAEYTKKIQAGDRTTILHYMDNTGAIKASDAPQTEVLLRMLIEIIQKHVQDPETIMAIAQDIKLATANRTLQSSIEGSVVSPEELAQAKRALGI